MLYVDYSCLILSHFLAFKPESLCQNQLVISLKVGISVDPQLHTEARRVEENLGHVICL